MKTNAISGSSDDWTNWSENILYKGNSFFFKPATKGELQAIIAQAAAAGASVRVSGQRHSQPPLVAVDNRDAAPTATPDTYIIDMSCYIDIGATGMQLGPAAHQVEVNPGIREDDLDSFLSENKLMLRTVTAGGFFSIGGMTAVDVNGATVDQPIFAETASAFTIMGADGTETVIDSDPELSFARVSLGALGVVTRITIDVAPRPQPNSVVGGHDRYMLKTEQDFVTQFTDLLTGANRRDRMEVFYTPYAADWSFLGVTNFLVLWWDHVDNPTPPAAQPPAQSWKTACEMASQQPPVFGAPFLNGLPKFGRPIIQALQFEDPGALNPTIPAAPIPAIAMDQIETQADVANARFSDLWLAEAARVVFMSYTFEMPKLDAAGLSKLWQALQVAGDYATDRHSGFHFAGPMEFRFIKAGKTALSATYSTDPDAYFFNLDLLAFTDAVPGKDYPDALLKAYAHVERAWVAVGGLPHQGKMHGFYDPTDPDTTSFTPPFNDAFVAQVTAERKRRGAPVDAFNAFAAARDPKGMFQNAYLRRILG